MTTLSIQPPFPLITDIDGQPLEDGYIWIGTANLPPIGNPIAVYWDAALTQPAALPIRTRGGYPVNAGTPARLYVNSDYSILVQNKNGSTLYSAPDGASDRFSAAQIAYMPAGTGAVATTVQAKLRETVSVKDFGAVGDGVTDDTAAIQAAINTATTVVFPEGNYRHGPITVTSKVKIVFASDAVITPLFDTGTTQTLYLVTAAGVVIEDFNLSAYAATLGANKYLIRADTGGNDLQVLRPKISGVTASDGNMGLTNLFVCHAIYADGVSNIRVWGGDFSVISGAAVFLKNVTNYSVIGNKINNTGWYSINLDHDCFDGVIAYNTISGDDVNARHWGGSINHQSNTVGAKNKRCSIIGNLFSGVHNYGAVIRLQSVEDMEVSGNILDRCVDGPLLTGPLQYIAITRRGTAEGAPENGPCINVSVVGNVMTAGLGIHWPVYVQNQYLATRDPHKNIIISGNIANSVDASNCFSIFCAAHGFKSGIESIKVINNIAKVYTQTGSPGGGVIGVLATQASGEVDGFEVLGNNLEDLTPGVPNQSKQIGVFVQTHSKNGMVRGNTFKNFRYGYRQAASLDNINGGNDNTYIGCLDDTLYSSLPAGGGFNMSIGTTIPVKGVYITGHIRQNPNAAASASFGWVVTTAGGAMTAAWASGQTYVAGTWYRNASNRVYELITAGGGTTSVEPTHTTVGQDVDNGDGYVWRCRSTTSARWATLPALGAAAPLP